MVDDEDDGDDDESESSVPNIEQIIAHFTIDA